MSYIRADYKPMPRSRLWQCPECLRVEQTALRKPRCEGTPDQPHPRRQAQPLAASAGILPADDRRLFK